MVFTSLYTFTVLSFLVFPPTFLLTYTSFHVGFYHVFFDLIFENLFPPSFIYPHTEDDSSMSRNV